MRDKGLVGFLLILLVIAFFAGQVWFWTSWNSCSESGGEFVRNMWGIYKCVKVVE